MLPSAQHITDRRFDFREAVWGAVRNLTIQGIALPLRWIGRLHFSPDSKIERVAVHPLSFEPGSPALTPEGEAIIARLMAPPELLRYMVVKGPICIDGISLTIIARDATSFSVSLVQYTQEHTNLIRRQPGDRINLETDIIARYVEQFVAGRESGGGAVHE